MNDMEWIDLWTSDKRTVLATMADNMSDDLFRGGYDPAGAIIRSEIEDMLVYAKEIERARESWRGMSQHEIALWCKRDMKRRGAIE